MLQEEKDRILGLFDHPQRWCQGIDATDIGGRSVPYDAAEATAWDLVSGLIKLFGEKRAIRLCESIARSVTRGDPKRRFDRWDLRNPAMSAMTALLDFNDDAQTSHDVLMDLLRNLPVWNGRRAEMSPEIDPSE